MANISTEIRCSTCFYDNPGHGCQLDPQSIKACRGNKRIGEKDWWFRYHNWVEKKHGISYSDYFDDGGKVIRDAIDKGIISDIVSAAEEGDRPRKLTWGRFFIGLCVVYTAVGVFDVLTDALYHLIMMLDEIFIASP
jgi:hypothetical protein